MKSRRKVELAIEDLKRFALETNRHPEEHGGYQVIWNLRRFIDELACDPASLRELLEGAQLLSASRGPGQGRTEQELFKDLTMIATDCGDKLEEHEASIRVRRHRNVRRLRRAHSA